MKHALLFVLCFTGCATVPLAAGDPAGLGVPVQVVGHVVSACGAPRPQPNEPVTVRAAGELEALDATRTDASGAFSFKVVSPSRRPSLLIEAGGKKALARQPFEGGTLVAEVRLPCER